MDDLFERTKNVISRDRIPSLSKVEYESEAGCFIESMVSCFQSIYPKRIIPRGFEEKIISRYKGKLGISRRDLVKETIVLSDLLDMEIEAIEITRHLPNTVEETREALEVPQEIPIKKTELNEISIKQPGHAGIVIMEGKEQKGHVVPIIAEKSLGLGGVDGINGSQGEADDYLREGYLTILILYLRAKEIK